MNEELRILITAEVAKARQNIQDFSNSMVAMGKAATKAAAITAATFTAIGAALTGLAKKSLDANKELSKLTTAFNASGMSSKQAGETYKDLYRFLGDSGKAVEAAGHLAKLTNNTENLAEWAKITQGIYATFGDSLPIESLTEAANETARTGKVVGTMADALNWAGVSEDAFNQQLEQTTTLEEREALIRSTLNGLYMDASNIYEKNNKSLLAYNESQAELTNTLASFKNSLIPLLTAVNNLANAFLTALKPAIEAVTPIFVSFINAISNAVSWVSAFFAALTGKQLNSVAETLGNASTGANNLGGSLAGATTQAEKLKRATMGFDELNIVPSQQTSGNSSGGSSSGGGISSGNIDTAGSGLTSGLDETAKKAELFAEKIKKVFDSLKQKINEWKTIFNPVIEPWKKAFENMNFDWDSIGTNTSGGFTKIKDACGGLLTYLSTDFIPNVSGSFSSLFATVAEDTVPWALEQGAIAFNDFGTALQTTVDEVIKPALDGVETATSDMTGTLETEWEESGETILTEISDAYTNIKDIFGKLWEKVIKPIWDKFKELVAELWNEHLKPLWDKVVGFISSIIQFVLALWNNVLAPIVGWLIDTFGPKFANVFNAIQRVVFTVVGIITDIIGTILGVGKGVLDFFTNVFKGNWSKAWESIKGIFKTIWDGMWSICKGIVNLIIDGINLLWTGIYNAISGLVNGIGSIAGAIGSLFGQDWSFSMPKEPPLIPRLATGGIVQAETLARIGEGGKKEAVLPLEQNTEWMDTLADKINGKNQTPTKIVLMLNEKELGYATINSINNITRQTGSLQLALI